MTNTFYLLAAQGGFLENLRWAALLFIALVISISLHEFGHAWAADKCGDPLPRRMGRVTLNPLAHADRTGTLIIPALMIFVPALLGGLPQFIFGWGKPVLVSLPNRETRMKDDILTTLAGPSMNLILAFIGAILLGAYAGIFGTENADPVTFFVLFIQLNLALMIFNLLPIPPLDGSRLMFYAAKMKEETYYKIAANAWWILLALILLPSPGNSFLSYIFRPIFEATFSPLIHFADWIARLFSAAGTV